MRKFFQKYDLVKITLIMIALTIILSWVIPQGYFNGAELSVGEITRVGMFDVVTYGLLGMYYFTVLVTFLFVVGATYQFLSKLAAYQKLTDKLATKIIRKEILFSLIVSFIFAALASILNEYMVLIAFMPFIITLCTKAKIDKISSFVMTFGSMLVGILGSTFSQKVVGMNVQFFQLQFFDGIWSKVIIFVLAFVIYSLFNVLHLLKVKGIQIFKKSEGKKTNKKDSKKTNKKETAKTEKVVVEKKVEFCEDLFKNEIKDNNSSNMIALIIVGVLSIITVILAYLPWTTVFKVEWFTKAYESVTQVEVFGVPLFGYILGNVQAFGSWDLFGIQVVMILSILILAICYRKGLTDIIESFADGFKKTAKLVVLLLLAYAILEFAVMYPVIPTIIGKIMGSSFNVFTTSLSALLTSLFTSEYQYAANLVYTFASSAYANDLNVFAIIFQSIYGLVSFFAPSSAMLLVGLSYLEIPYKDWMKYIWKFLLAMLVVIIVVALVIA